MTDRERLLRDAAEAVRQRGETYGSPQAHFARTAGAINAILGHKLSEPLTAADWGICMILDKMAREQHSHKRDNMIDAAGYAACVAEIKGEDYVAADPPKADEDLSEVSEAVEETLETVAEIIERRKNFDAPIL